MVVEFRKGRVVGLLVVLLIRDCQMMSQALGLEPVLERGQGNCRLAAVRAPCDHGGGDNIGMPVRRGEHQGEDHPQRHRYPRLRQTVHCEYRLLYMMDLRL